MDHQAHDQTGIDGFWVYGVIVDINKLYTRIPMSIYRCVSSNTRFKGIGFRSRPVEVGDPVYFFTNIRNHKGVRPKPNIVESTGVNREVLGEWIDNSSCFSSDVFVKLFRRDVTLASEKLAWADCFKDLVLHVGEDALSDTTIISRHMFVHRADIADVQLRFLDSLLVPMQLTGIETNPFSRYVIDEYKLQGMNARRICSFCSWYDGSKMKMCSCRSGVHYCSKKCQSVHWRMVHKKECKARVFEC